MLCALGLGPRPGPGSAQRELSYDGAELKLEDLGLMEQVMVTACLGPGGPLLDSRKAPISHYYCSRRGDPGSSSFASLY